MDDVGFPDFAQPYFFNATSLPHSNLDRVSARYEAQAVTPWLANLSLTAYYQRTERLLQNPLPVQFPAPTPIAFFPISVFRLDILSETEQRVWTPGVDLQAVLVPASNHLLTTGADVLSRPQQRPARPRRRTTSLVGQVALGARGPAPVVLPVAGPARAAVDRATRCACRTPACATSRCSRRTSGACAPNAVARRRPARRLLQRDHRGDAGLRRRVRGRRRDAADRSGDAARPERRDLHAAGADRRHRPRRQPGGRVSPFVRFGRSYRHPNLEEMLFAGTGDGRQHRAERAR